MSNLILITPPTSVPNEERLLVDLFERGVSRLHIRKSTLSGNSLRNYVIRIPSRYRKRIVLHHDHSLALELGLGGRHFRERDIPVDGIVAIPGQTASMSYHTPDQLLQSTGEADYCLLAPVYPSISKPGHVPSPAIEDRHVLSEYINASRYPVIALGGITPDRFQDLVSLGFSGAALLGAVWDAPDPLLAWEQAKQAAEEVLWEGSLHGRRFRNLCKASCENAAYTKDT